MSIWQSINEKVGLLFSDRKLAGAAQELAFHAEKFEGLYETAYLFAQDQALPSPLNEWAVRAQAVSPDGGLAVYLETLNQNKRFSGKSEKQAKHLLRVIDKAGIRRETSEDRKLSVSGVQVRAYIALDGHKIIEGETIRILKAAWYLNERIVEHGLAGEFS